MATPKKNGRRKAPHANYGPERHALVVELGHLLKAAREERGLSTRGLAALAGIPQCTVMRYEYGQREPRVFNLVVIARALGMASRISEFLEKSSATLPGKITADQLTS